MKKILSILLVAICLFCLSTAAFAGSGSAIISHYTASGSWFTFYLYISNITDNVINVKVTLFKTNGTITSGSEISYVSNSAITNWINNLNDASASFSLNGNCTAQISVNFTPGDGGYGIIEWTQNSKVTRGLVAYGRGVGSSAYYYTSENIIINEGQSF